MFTAAFTPTQSDDCKTLTITDNSDYSSEGQGTFSARRIYLYKSDGSTIKYPDGSLTDYIDFSFANYPSGIIALPVMDKDYCFRIKLELVSTAPQGGSTYTLEKVYASICYTRQSIYSVGQAIAANPSLLKDRDFYDNLSKLQTEMDVASNAAIYEDQNSSQQALNRAKKIIDETNLRF